MIPFSPSVMAKYRPTIVVLATQLICSSRGAFVTFDTSVLWNSLHTKRANFPDFHCGISRRLLCLKAGAGSSSETDSSGNSTGILRSVGAAGNLRFRKSGSNPVDEKRDEPNFKVKPADEEAKSPQGSQKRFHDVIS